MGFRAGAWLVLALLGAPGGAGAAESPALVDLARGDRVRLRLSSGGKTVRGTVDHAGPHEFVVRPTDPAQPPLRLSPQQVAKLEVVRGRRSRWRGGAAIGFVPGALFVAYAVAGLSECDPDCDYAGPALGYGLVGGAITGGVGALIGLAVKTDRWVAVEGLRPKVGLTLGPTKGGLRAELSLRF